jgi:hypothetical protein
MTTHDAIHSSTLHGFPLPVPRYALLKAEV